jgi:hypothetical protein
MSYPFDDKALGLDIANKVFMEVASSSKEYGLLIDYIPRHVINNMSNMLHSARSTGKSSCTDRCGQKVKRPCEEQRVPLNLGLGVFTFQDHEKKHFHGSSSKSW